MITIEKLWLKKLAWDACRYLYIKLAWDACGYLYIIKWAKNEMLIKTFT